MLASLVAQEKKSASGNAAQYAALAEAHKNNLVYFRVHIACNKTPHYNNKYLHH